VRRVEQCLQTGTAVRAGATERGVRIDMSILYRPPVAGRVGPGNSDLISDRRLPLQVDQEAGVYGAAHGKCYQLGDS